MAKKNTNRVGSHTRLVYEEKIGDFLVREEATTSIYNAVIDFNDLVEAVEIEPDDHSETPWDSCDGYSHHFERGTLDYDDRHEQLGYVKRSSRDGGSGLIVLDDDDQFGMRPFLTVRGASRQVIAEHVAYDRHRTLDQLRTWYLNGWEWWYAKLEYGDDYYAGVGGIDSYEYADKEVRQDLASEVAHEMEKHGFTVVNKPEPYRYRRLSSHSSYGPGGSTDEQVRESIRRNINLFNWPGDVKRGGRAFRKHIARRIEKRQLQAMEHSNG